MFIWFIVVLITCCFDQSMKIKELNQKPKDELKKNLGENRELLRSLRFDLAAGKVKNIRQLRTVKKDIAKILTLLNQKQY